MKIKKNVYTLQDVKKIKEIEYNKGLRDGFSHTFEQMILFPMLILRDKWGFGAKRLEQFIDYYKENLDYFVNGEIDLEDVSNALEEETGIKLKGLLKEEGSIK